MLRLTMLLASAFLICQAGAIPRQEGAEGGKKRDRVEEWGELEKQKDREDEATGDEKDLEGDAKTPSHKDKPEKEKEEDKSNRESDNPTADNYNCTRGRDSRFDICRDTMWQGCVGVEDRRLHPRCDDVPGYDYGCHMGACWSICDSRHGNLRCWLGSNYQLWVDELGTSMWGPRGRRNPEFVPCREKRDCANRSPWLLQCIGYCKASMEELKLEIVIVGMRRELEKAKLAAEGNQTQGQEGGSMRAS